MNDNQVYYIHMRYHNNKLLANGENRTELLSKGGVTIAYHYDSPSGVCVFAMAWCSPKDVFNKRVGRAKAGGRLRSEKQSETLICDKGADRNTIIQHLRHIAVEEKERFVHDIQARLW